jgi:hypothetical protein
MSDTHTTTATQPVTVPGAIARDFADTWCGGLTSSIATALNCAEVDVLADLLRALGADQAADEWIEEHADGDEPGDDHYQDPVPDAMSLATDGARWNPSLTDPKEQGS